MKQMQELVLITGCGSGIGQALARAFHRNGQRVCATARRLDTLAPLAAEGLLVRALDVTDAEATSTLLASLAADGLAVGTLVNNAGYGAMGPMLDVPQSEWQRQFDVNLFAPMALVRAVMPGMVERGRGLVVNISSVLGHRRLKVYQQQHFGRLVAMAFESDAEMLHKVWTERASANGRMFTGLKRSRTEPWAGSAVPHSMLYPAFELHCAKEHGK